MESLKLSFESVMPIFLLIALGYGLKRSRLVSDEVFGGANKLIFKVFLPILLFYNVYKTDRGQVFDLKLILFAVLGTLAVFLGGAVAVLLLTKDNSKRGVVLQGIFRSNFAILGVPLVKLVCGEGSGGLASLMVAVVVPLFNVLAVITLERFRQGRLQPLKMLKGVAANPLIIGCLLGAAFLFLGIPLPVFLENTVGSVADMASPLAMIVLGASFTFTSIKGRVKELVFTLLAKLIFVPAVMLTLAVLLGLRGEALACVMVVFGAPTAVSSFTMAEQMGGDGKLAAQIVVLTSAACLLTLFGWIFLLSFCGWL